MTSLIFLLVLSPFFSFLSPCHVFSLSHLYSTVCVLLLSNRLIWFISRGKVFKNCGCLVKIEAWKSVREIWICSLHFFFLTVLDAYKSSFTRAINCSQISPAHIPQYLTKCGKALIALIVIQWPGKWRILMHKEGSFLTFKRRFIRVAQKYKA